MAGTIPPDATTDLAMLRLPIGRSLSRPLLLAAAAGVAIGGLLATTGGAASAHTESEFVAVPAGDEVTINFAPTHGCSGSPTTGVSVRVPAPGATAGDVEGFTASAEPDGDRTVLRWSGGLVPADQEGEFPITFTVPDTVGELLLFPTVQTCEVGEIAWIDGDPAGEYPAVRILVLAAGSEAAHDIDEVPLDAPGRDLLTSIVDVDNPAATTVPEPASAPPTTGATATTVAPTTAPAATTTVTATTAPDTTTAAPATTSAATTVPATSVTTAASDDDDGSSTGPIIVVSILAVLVAIGAGVGIARRRSA
jgi:hypothetical protein